MPEWLLCSGRQVVGLCQDLRRCCSLCLLDPWLPRQLGSRRSETVLQGQEDPLQKHVDWPSINDRFGQLAVPALPYCEKQSLAVFGDHLLRLGVLVHSELDLFLPVPEGDAAGCLL